MILCDREIEALLDLGRVVIDPRPDPAFMDSTTVDLRLGGTLDRWEFPPPKPGLGQTGHRFCPGIPGFRFGEIEREFAKPVEIPDTGYELPPSYLSTPETGPRHFILGWTVERIHLPHTARLCARVEGKSSLGRMGLGVHVTAPTIHAGFGRDDTGGGRHGASLRLEIWNVSPLRSYWPRTCGSVSSLSKKSARFPRPVTTAISTARGRSRGRSDPAPN